MATDIDFYMVREVIVSVGAKLAIFRSSYCTRQRQATAGMSPFLDDLISQLEIAGQQLESHEENLIRDH